MPRKRMSNYRRPRKVRAVRRPRRRIAARATINRSIAPVAPRFVTKLKYADEWIGPASLGAVNQYVFNLNSLFDPNRTATGHQPYGYDQLSALYDKYRVFAVSWQIEVTGNTATSIPRLTVIPFDGTLALSTLRTYTMEFPRAITREGCVGNSKVFIRGHIGLPKLRGQTAVEYKGDDENTASTGANPTHVLTLNCCVAASDASTTLDFQARAVLMYHCEFYDPNAPSQS